MNEADQKLLDACYSALSGYSEDEPAKVIKRLIAKNTEQKKALDYIAAALAMPEDSSPDRLALAARMCTRRCDELERNAIAFQESHTYAPTDTRSLEQRVASLEARVNHRDKTRPLTLELTLDEITIVACAIEHHSAKGFAMELCKAITDKIRLACK